MTHLTATTCATDLSDTQANARLAQQGYSIRHIETWQRDSHSDTIIVWDSPSLTELELPY